MQNLKGQKKACFKCWLLEHHFNMCLYKSTLELLLYPVIFPILHSTALPCIFYIKNHWLLQIFKEVFFYVKHLTLCIFFIYYQFILLIKINCCLQHCFGNVQFLTDHKFKGKYLNTCIYNRCRKQRLVQYGFPGRYLFKYIIVLYKNILFLYCTKISFWKLLYFSCT